MGFRRMSLTTATSAAIRVPTVAWARDAAARQRVSGQSRAHHTVEQARRHGVGPNLPALFGRRARSVEGFHYSAPMRAKGEGGLVSSAETLAPYLENPREFVPGTSMAFADLRQGTQRNDVIAYLRQATGAAP